MISLKDFLETADQDNQVALQQARDYTANQGKLIAATTVNSVLAELNMTGIVKDIANDPTHVARHKMASVILGIQGGEPFNFIQGTSRGDGVIAMLDWLAENVEAEHQPKIVMFKNVLAGMANSVVQPFANATLHDILVIRDACPTKELFSVLTPPNTYIIVNLLSDVPTHAARITAVNPRTNQREILGRVWLSKAALYQFKVPSHYLDHLDFEIDDPYGAIE